ncbi:MAG: hypothetical protein FWC91_08150 [Defluviitaleaceae bacterium]|nr:hypothetical protein [Defluviitaleaceae bacterium]
MLSKERADIICSILTEDLDRAKELSTLETKKAVEEFNKLRPGHNFTLDELVEYSKSTQELDFDELDQVAGGATFPGVVGVVPGPAMVMPGPGIVVIVGPF